jgi:hypothetical protein
MYAFFLSLVRAACPTHLILHHFIILIIFSTNHQATSHVIFPFSAYFFPHTSKCLLQPNSQLLNDAVSSRKKDHSAQIIIRLHLEQKLRMHGALTPFYHIPSWCDN